jgi:GAF domain-containing protein
MQIHPESRLENTPKDHIERDLGNLLNRLTVKMQQDALIRQTTSKLRDALKVDRVILYYLYEEWLGQVTFESLSNQELSILGTTGPEDGFTAEYAALYLAGRTRAIDDIEVEPIQACHRDFLRGLQVRANLIVPILIPRGLWGLLIAHHCSGPHPCLPSHVELMLAGAKTLATDPTILES